jgi:hypothetical protein
VGGQIGAVNGVTAGGGVPVATLTHGDPALIIGVGMVVIVGTDVANSIVILVSVGSLVLLYVVAAGGLVEVGACVPGPLLLEAMGMILDIAADVADIVVILVYVVTSLGFQIGMLAGGGVPVLGFVVEPSGIKGVFMGGLFLSAGGQHKGQRAQGQEQSEYLFHGKTPFLHYTVVFL